MKNIFLPVMLVLATVAGDAQIKHLKFYSINSAGLVTGVSPVAAAYETVNGLSFSSWFAGVGAGLDNYHFKSIPVFADVRRFFGNEKRIFVFGNIGGNLPVQKQAAKEFFYYNNNYYFKGGFYTDAGIGYQFPLIKKTSLVFSLSNSYKSLQAHAQIFSECFFAPCSATFRDYHYNFYRIMVKAGLMF